MIQPPQDFGRYRIEKLLGRGAMGEVFLATDTQLQRQVALKIPKIDSAEGVERFRREALAAAKLRHPNICQVYDVGEQDGKSFLGEALELV